MTKLQRVKKLGRKYVNPVPTAIGGARLMFKALSKLIAGSEERVPLKTLGPFRTDVAAYATAPASGLRITWFGHSSMLVEIDGVRILVDPVWDKRASPVQWAGPQRFFPPTLKLEELPRLDAVLISHDHFDHLGAGTVGRLASLQPDVRWLTSLGVGAVLQGFGVRPEQVTELDWTESAEIAGASGAMCKVTSLPSRHFSGRSMFNRFQTLWASFVLRGSEQSVYYGADSGWWEGFAEIGATYGPFDLTMLEVGAYDDLWRQIHLGPDAAVRAFRELGGAGSLMPIHWGLFNLAFHAWRWPIERMRELADEQRVKLWQPAPGLPTEVVRGVEVRSDWWQ